MLCSLLLASALAAAPTPVDRYEVLTGEDFAGSGFVVRHQGAFLGVCSLHQFEGAVPNELVPLDGDPLRLDPSRVVKQTDVQVLPVQSPPPDLPFLDYHPDFRLAPGDPVFVFDAGGAVVPGTLAPDGMSGGAYHSSAGPATLSLRTDRSFTAAGASGSPVVLERTGAVVGVLLTADDPRAARTVGFETLCLDARGPLTVRRPPLSQRLGAIAGSAVGLLLVHAVVAAVVCVPVLVLIRLTRPKPAPARPPVMKTP